MCRYVVLDIKENYALEMCISGYHPIGTTISHKGKLYKVLRVEGGAYNGK